MTVHYMPNKTDIPADQSIQVLISQSNVQVLSSGLYICIYTSDHNIYTRQEVERLYANT